MNGSMPEMANRRRLLWIVVGGLLLSAALLWGSSRMPWFWTLRDLPGGGRLPSETTGAQQQPSLVPLALLSLAAIAATVAAGGWLRRAIGVLVALAGGIVLWLGFGSLGDIFGSHPDGHPTAAVVIGRLLAVAAGLCLLGCGVTLVRAAKSLPRLGAAYQAPGSQASGEKERPKDPDQQMWEVLSEGEDPTR
jgi:uncharacterized membrane protein (TIGR02234 family)